MNYCAGTLAHLGSVSLSYGSGLLEGVEPSAFARVCQGQAGSLNHPAWCYGHLASYFPGLLQAIGRDPASAPALPDPSLFGMGSDCVDDAEGKVYPPMPVIVDAFRLGFEAAISAVGSLDEAALERENPNERSRSRMPTIGAMFGFMLGGHAMTHLGQVSAWRRGMGMPRLF